MNWTVIKQTNKLMDRPKLTIEGSLPDQPTRAVKSWGLTLYLNTEEQLNLIETKQSDSHKLKHNTPASLPTDWMQIQHTGPVKTTQTWVPYLLLSRAMTTNSDKQTSWSDVI